MLITCIDKFQTELFDINPYISPLRCRNPATTATVAH